ncbi:MAG: DUF4388 domain-containing protein, partial [Myxococcales bacterium]|nr:DUF4388 domain-containing protein [Myxococcales bacterium]
RCDVDGRGLQDDIGELLLLGGLIDRAQLDQARKVQKKTLGRIGDILQERGAVPQEAVVAARDLQTRERLYRLFQQQTGRYRFEAKPPNFTRPTINPISAETVLMEGLRMADEWPLIRTRINNYDAVFRAVREAGAEGNDADQLEALIDDAFSEFVDPAVKAGGAVAGKLGAAERRVLELVDGRRDIHRLIARSRLGEFETCKALYNLLQEGYIEPVRAVKRRAQPSQRKSARWRGVALKVAVNGVLLAGIVGLALVLPGQRSALEDNAAQLATEAQLRLRANRMASVATALEVFRLERGAYPERLDELVEAELVDPTLLVPLGGVGFNYVGIGVDYVLQ